MADIAIIGTGISGLGAASLLHKAGHNITVYEKSFEIGGHARTRIVQYADVEIAVDTGFIVFNYPNYPHLSALFKQLEVPVEKSDMTFACTINSGELEWGAKNLNTVFGQRSNLFNPMFIKMLRDVLRFNKLSPGIVEKDPTLTLEGLMKQLGTGEWFAKYYILPIGGAIWSTPLPVMLSFPAKNFVEFFKAHGLLATKGQPQWHTIKGGSREYVKLLSDPFSKQIKTSTAVTSVTRQNGRVQVFDSKEQSAEYDQVVFASHADQALAILRDATPEERDLLGAFKFQKNLAILHKDDKVMPKRERCWASWVYHDDKYAYLKKDALSVTYWMNLLQNIDTKFPLFVTLNPQRPIDHKFVFDEFEFEHPIYSLEAAAAQMKFPAIQGQNNTWYTGAWLRNGFHEDGFASAVDVAKALGAKIPWETQAAA